MSSHRQTSGQSTTERRESAPLLAKPAAACVNENSVEDLTNTVPPSMYGCLSRSCSIGSQLSAAASTIHEESFHDLSLDGAGSNHGEYLPMSRLRASKDETSETTKCSASEETPLIGATSRRDDATANYIFPSSALLADSTVPPPSASAGYRDSRDDDDGYLHFRSIPATPSSDEQNSGGSLERLGPPPEIPTSAAADYIVPLLPPKQHASSELRANSLLLSGRPRIVERRRGSADSRGAASASSWPAVPSRENRDLSSIGISAVSVCFSVRPAVERRVPHKPNLTVDAVASANFVYTGEEFELLIVIF